MTDENKSTVKRTVVLHTALDACVRQAWAKLIEHGYNATYSMALNLLLIAAITEAKAEEGWSRETNKIIRDFVRDQKTVDHLNLQDYLGHLREHLDKPE